MKLAIMQPYFFPYIGYFQLINAVDSFMIYDDVTYINRGWVNRNYVLVNGSRFLLTLPLHKASCFKLIKDLEMNTSHKILKTLQHHYTKAPQFKVFYPVLQSIFDTNNNNNLSDFLTGSLVSLCNYMGIKTKILKSSEFAKNNDLKGKDKIIDICKSFGADVYVNAIGGQDLYSKSEFKDHAIDLFFLQSNLSPYNQFGKQFVPGLSIIDELMFKTSEQITDTLERYELV